MTRARAFMTKGGAKKLRAERLQADFSFPFLGAFLFGRKHPSRDAIFFGQDLPKLVPKIITSHDVLEPLKQVLLASCDVIISGQICGSKL